MRSDRPDDDGSGRDASRRVVRHRPRSSLAFQAILTLVALTAATAEPSSQPLSIGVINAGKLRRVDPGIWVIEDRAYAPAVPNVGIITGTRGVLVVDPGIDGKQASKVLAIARRIAGRRRLYATSTHFHPEHAFGLATFVGKATIIENSAQAAETRSKGKGYVRLFTSLGMGRLVQATRFAAPDIVYRGTYRLDLGERIVEFNEGHAGHTLGDQIVTVGGDRAVFMGDLLETASFPILPWYPEIGDIDVSPSRWIDTLRWVEARRPAIVVPGHGPVGDASSLATLAVYMEGERDAMKARCSAVPNLAALRAALSGPLRRTHPDWHLSEWIDPGLSAFAKDYCPGPTARSSRATTAGGSR